MANYSFLQDVAQAGQEAEGAIIRQVDSFAVEGSDIPFGRAVMRGTNPEKQVRALDTAVNFLGVSVFRHAVAKPELAAYSLAAKETAAIMTKGRIYVKLLANVRAGETAFVTDTGLFTNNVLNNHAIGKFITSGSANGLAILEIQ
jgi:hypothetical protein